MDVFHWRSKVRFDCTISEVPGEDRRSVTLCKSLRYDDDDDDDNQY